ncbi:MAG: anaerobic ribonucleoside-triphosphate reductase activating protein, partial [Eubacteriaceae bacterium]|nr:anaerobic ribonucleoside-triphosphate reductase activating protein [Eubacteriaceae bacterium]
SILSKSGIDFEVRTTVYPQLTKEDLINMAEELPLLPRYVLNRYRKPSIYMPQDKARIEHRPCTQEEILILAESIRSIQPNVIA